MLFKKELGTFTVVPLRPHTMAVGGCFLPTKKKNRDELAPKEGVRDIGSVKSAEFH